MSKVKITTKGKVHAQVSDSLKPYLKHLLELFINDKPKKALDLHTAGDRINHALINEIYVKHFQHLSMLNGTMKLVLTISQAHALWMLSQEYDQYSYQHVEMGHLLMELHQKLS